jgi:hypothetical protein
MKKLLKLLGLCLLIVSCSKDDEAPLTGTPTSVVGKWMLLEINFYSNNVLVNTEIENQDNNTCPDYIQFNSNRTYNNILKDANCNITFSSNGHYIYDPSLHILRITETGESFAVINITNNDLTTELSYTESGIPKKRKAYYQKIN